jgi:hypothetical protein
LSGVEVVFEWLTLAPGEEHTKGTHGDSPPQKRACPFVRREYPHVGSHVKVSSDHLSNFLVLQKIFFLRSIAQSLSERGAERTLQAIGLLRFV